MSSISRFTVSTGSRQASLPTYAEIITSTYPEPETTSSPPTYAKAVSGNPAYAQATSDSSLEQLRGSDRDEGGPRAAVTLQNGEGGLQLGLGRLQSIGAPPTSGEVKRFPLSDLKAFSKIPPQPRQHPIPLPSAEGFPVLPPIPRLPLRTLLLLEHPRFPRKRFPLLAQRMLPGILPQLRQLLSFSRILS